MFDDDLFAHLTPRGTFDHILTDVHIPRDNPKPVVLRLKFCGRGSAYLNAVQKLKPLADERAANERASKLFALHGVDGWENVQKDGQDLAYTPELGAEVFTKLIRARVDEKVALAIGEAMNANNFREPLVEADELGKD
jgi:hypothetical protein